LIGGGLLRLLLLLLRCCFVRLGLTRGSSCTTHDRADRGSLSCVSSDGADRRTYHRALGRSSNRSTPLLLRLLGLGRLRGHEWIDAGLLLGPLVAVVLVLVLHLSRLLLGGKSVHTQALRERLRRGSRGSGRLGSRGRSRLHRGRRRLRRCG